MNTKIEQPIDVDHQIELAHFALECGADRFVLHVANADAEALLAECRLGTQRLADYTHENSFCSNLPVWRLSAKSVLSLETALRSLPPNERVMSFYRREAPFAHLRDDGGKLLLWDEQRNRLFNLGFRFLIPSSDGSNRLFTLEDSMRSQRPSTLPRLTLDALVKNKCAYESRRPLRGIAPVDLTSLDNHHIHIWWTPVQDAVLREQLRRDGIAWWPSVSALLRTADVELVARWKTSDPACLRSDWRALITAFARARAQALGLDREARTDGQMPCASCDAPFALSESEKRVREQSPTFVRVPGFNNICPVCISSSFGSSSIKATEQEIKQFVRSLCETLGRIPSPDFGHSTSDYETLNESQLAVVVRLLAGRPSRQLIEKSFGSWLNTLIESGVLAGNVRRTARGIQCVARDGHVCMSLGEKMIDDLLQELGLEHKKEAHYPGSNLRCDFLVNGVYIEYFGLTGDPTYDMKTEVKQKLCQTNGWHLLAVFPEDLLQSEKLRQKLSCLQTEVLANVYRTSS